MFCHFFIKIRLYLAARRVENISSGVIFNLLSGGFLILAKIKIHYFERNCMLKIYSHLRFKMIETPDNTAPRRDLLQCNTRWIKSYAGGPRSFEGHEKVDEPKRRKIQKFCNIYWIFLKIKI